MPEIVCPACESVTLVETVRRDAESFCANAACDFPLFWVATPVPTVVDPGGETVGDGGVVRRSPGVDGRLELVHIACPACSELNDRERVFCVRCESELRPAPVVVPPPPPVAAPIPEEVIIEESGWEAWVLVGVMLVVLAAVAVWAYIGI